MIREKTLDGVIEGVPSFLLPGVPSAIRLATLVFPGRGGEVSCFLSDRSLMTAEGMNP